MTPGRKFSMTTSAAVDELAGEIAVGFSLEVEDDAALVAVVGGVGGAVPDGAAGRVDADDIGALVAQEHGRHGAGDVLAEVDNLDAVESARHCRILPANVARSLTDPVCGATLCPGAEAGRSRRREP